MQAWSRQVAQARKVLSSLGIDASGPDFDEAQRAWNSQMTANFMKRKKGRSGFTQSEPEFLISYMDRHSDWAVIVCLVGGGQEINTGEAGISAWLNAVIEHFPHWKMFISILRSSSRSSTILFPMR